MDYEKLYNELIYAVGKKWPDESRHQTALRYIQQAEQQDDISEKQSEVAMVAQKMIKTFQNKIEKIKEETK